MILMIRVLAVPAATALLAWVCWLGFNLLIARRHGIAGLKATPAIAKAFRPRDWLRSPRARPPLARPGLESASLLRLYLLSSRFSSLVQASTASRFGTAAPSSSGG